MFSKKIERWKRFVVNVGRGVEKKRKIRERVKGFHLLKKVPTKRSKASSLRFVNGSMRILWIMPEKLNKSKD